MPLFEFIRDRRGAESEFKDVRRGTGRDPGGFPCLIRTSFMAGEKDGGMADVAAIDSEQN